MSKWLENFFFLLLIHPCGSSQHNARNIRANRVRIMVFNATFNNILIISWRSVFLVEETGGPGENHRPVSSGVYKCKSYIYITIFQLTTGFKP
jgi:hypothetical protein